MLLLAAVTDMLVTSFAVPALVLLIGITALSTAMNRDSPRQLSFRDKLADALSASLGISPRTRRRG